MKKYIFYVTFLILWSAVLSVFEGNGIGLSLNLIIAILICILYELIEINNKKEGN